LRNPDLIYPLLMPFFHLIVKSEEETSYRVTEIFKSLNQKYLDKLPDNTRTSILEFVSKQFVLVASNPKTNEAQREIIYHQRAKIQKTLFKIKINEYQPLRKKRRRTFVNRKNITKELSDSDQEVVDDPDESEEEIPLHHLL